VTDVKNWFIAVLLFVVALPGAAYSQKLRVGTLYIGSTMLPLWIARDEGYFARRGLEVELIWLQSALSTMALIAGEADLIYGTPQETLLAMAVKSPPPLVTVGSWEPSSKHWLVVSPKIQSVKDLVGKILATSRPKAADEGYARIILRRFGVDSSRVTFLSAGGQRERMNALRAGSVQGSVFNTYNSLTLAELGFKKLAILETDDFPFPPATFTTRKQTASVKREPLKAFLSAVVEGTRTQSRDRELSLTLLKKYMKIQNPKVLEVAYQDSLMVQYPYMTPDQLESSLAILEASTSVRPSVTFQGFVDHSLLKETQLKQENNNR
jgi:ABC-type nitrate/sulfonate/bicarbonate transport system substrate-binding protein